jgi:hypothetical protein
MNCMESWRKRSSVAAAMVACALAAPAFAQLLPAALPVNPGELVHTLEAPNDLVPPPSAGGADLDDPVVLLFNVNNPAAQGAVLDTNWSANRFWNAGAGVHEWTARNLGNVFGVCLDRANNPNIYVANANYVLLGYGGFGQTPLWGPGGPGGVYQLHGTTGNICRIADIPDAGVGQGDVVHGVRGNVLYVSNFEDGLIYRVPIPQACPPAPYRPTGAPGTFWDHGVELLGPGNADDGQPNTFTSLRRRVWGMAVNEGESKLYYGTWLEDSANPNGGTNNQIWSVDLDATGNFITGTQQLQATTPALVPLFGGPVIYTAPIADITFGPNGNMYIAERSIGSVHYSRALELSGGSGAWAFQPTPKWRLGRYQGQFAPGHNAAGGIGVDCDGNVWGSSDAIILGNIGLYGLHRINNGGNAADLTPTTNGYLIDSDDNVLNGGGDKTTLGSLAIRRECADCGRIAEENIICKPPQPDGTPCYTYTFAFTNLSGQPVNQLNIASPLVSPNPIIFNPPLANNATQFITLTICGPAGGTSIDLPFILFNQQGQVCCNFRKRVTLPDCDCFVLEGNLPPQTTCIAPGQFSVQFFLQPTDYAIGHIFISPTGVPAGSTTVTPGYIPLAIPQWGAGNVNFNVNTTLPPGTRICFTIVVHKPDFSECCSKDVCITVPDCRPGGNPCNIDFNNNGVFPEDQDVTDFFNVLAGGPCSTPNVCDDIDFNNNGVFPEDQDIIDYLNVLAGAPCP